MNQYDITFIGCDNIFKNVVIKLGKTKEKIIKSQIEYLNSDNYCISKHKKIQENDTVGILICKRENKFVIEYCSDEKIAVRKYELV